MNDLTNSDKLKILYNTTRNVKLTMEEHNKLYEFFVEIDKELKKEDKE